MLAKLIDKIRRGDALVVVRIDRLARSVSHLLAAIEELEDKKAHSARCTIRCFRYRFLVPWRSSSGRLFPNGRRRGLKRRKPAVSFCNPGFRELRRIRLLRRRGTRRSHRADLTATMSSWLPIVQRKRPDHP